MYKNLLVPTDGSKLSSKAVAQATALAKLAGARITLYYSMPAYPDPVYVESAIMAAYVPPDVFKDQSAKFATKVLAKETQKIAAAGVKVEACQSASTTPWEGIIEVAQKRKCDLIVMASHGRRGVAGFLLGSETQKVLTHSKVPVLVVR